MFSLFIQRCKNCSKEFQWKTIINSIWSGYKPIECDNCKSKHYPKFIYRFIVALSIALPIFFSQFLYGIFKTYLFIILAYIIWVLVVVSIAPFYFRYYIKD
ncbi:MAG: hypothetical protein FH753_02075 [Firmicutes bacterium]|nr:hypothetical protein [Bacillota bacterium]